MSNEEMLPNEAERNPVVKIVNGEAMADSRDVAAYFGKAHKDVLRAIRELHCSEEFRQRNFAPFKIKDLTGESTSHFEMTKDGFAFAALGFTGAKAGRFKESYIVQFNAMENELRSRPPVDPVRALHDPATLRSLLLAQAEQNLQLQGQIAEAQPRLQALERIADSDGSFCVTDAAKTLQARPKDLFAFLRGKRWIYSRAGGGEIAYQDKLQSGLLEHKTTTVNRTDGTEKVVTQVRVTPKGLTVLAQHFGQH